MKQYFTIKGIEHELGSEVYNSQRVGKRFVTKDNPEEKVEHFIRDVLGKETIYRFKEDDNLVQICGEVGKRLLEKNHVDPREIDMVICTSVVPEYYMPVVAIMLHNELGLRSDVKVVMDINVNCVGMLTALYNINAIMSIDEEVNNILILDIMTLAHYSPIEDIVGAVSFSDAAVALLVSRRDHIEEGLYFQAFQDSSQVDYLKGPGIGTYQFFNSKIHENFRVKLNTMLDCKMEEVVDFTKKFFERHNEDLKAYKHCCFSQYVRANINMMRDGLGLSDENIPYIGREMGYTGPSSPMLALNKRIKEGKVQSGDKIFFWTNATGLQHVLMTAVY